MVDDCAHKLCSKNEEQQKLTELDAEVKQQTQIQQIFKQLLDVSAERKTAIEENRELILSGLKAVDVPGADDLGVIESTRNAGRTTGIFGD